MGEHGEAIGIYGSSRLYGYLSSFADHLSRKTLCFLAWGKDAFDASLTGAFLRRCCESLKAACAGSVFVKIGIWGLGLFVAPSGEPLRMETFLGAIAAAGCFMPTEILILAALFFLFLTLWERAAKTHDRSSRPGQIRGYGGLLALPGFGLFLPLAVTFLFLAGAAVSSVVPRASAVSFLIWCFYILFFLMGFDAAFRGKAESVIWPVLAGVTLSSLVGIYQHFSGWQPPRSWLDEKFEGEIVRVVGTFTNPTFFAEMIGLALPVTLALLLKSRAWKDRIVLSGYAACQGFALILTYSRGAWLGFMVSFAVMAVFYERKLLILGLLAAVAALFLAPPVLVERLLSSFTLDDSSNSYRMFIWRGSIALLKANFLRGVGLGAESFVHVYPEYMIIQTPAPHAHSTYLEMLIELGLLGFTALMWFLVAWASYVFFTILKAEGRWGKRWAEIGILSGIFSAIAGHMVQGVVEYTWYSPKIAIVYWMWVGLSAGIAALRRRDEAGLSQGRVH